MTHATNTAERDFPPSTEPPRSCYLIASLPRTGSTLLGDALWATGRAGAPVEYFNPVHMKDYCLRLGGRPTLGQSVHRFLKRRAKPREFLGLAGWSRPEIEDYVRRLAARRTSPNGVFAVKAHYQQVDELFLSKGLELEDVLGRLRYVYIKRSDHLRQAVSGVKAGQTGSWAHDIAARKEPRYDPDGIRSFLGDVERWEAAWERYFEERGIEPHRVEYEDLAENYEARVRETLRFLAIDGWEELAIEAPELKKQSDDVTEEWVRRWREEEEAVARP